MSDKSEIKDRINSLQRKINKKDKKIQQLELKINKITKKKKRNKKNSKNKQISRRRFLKKLGVGAAGLGALTMSPTSALNIKDENLNVFTGSNNNNLNEHFTVNQGGPVEIIDTNFNIKNSSGTEYLTVNQGGPVTVQEADLKISSTKSEALQLPAYENSNLPTGKPEGTIVYDKTNNQLVIEDGT